MITRRRGLITGAAALTLPFVITRRALGATVINSVGTAGGRDFSTIGAWLGALPSGPNGNTYWGQLYPDTEFNELVVFSGHGALPIIMSPAPGFSFRDNPSVRSNPLYYNASNGVGLTSNANPPSPYQSMVVVLDNNVTINGMQFYMAGGGSCFNSGFLSSASTITVNYCIFVQLSGAALNTSYTTYNNCLFVGLDSNPLAELIEVNTPITSNFWNFGTFASPNGMENCFDVNPGGFPTGENLAVFGFTNTGAGASFTNCMTDVASPPSGFVGGKVYANQFVNVSSDFRQKAGADLRGAGISDPTNGAFDISGFARPQAGVGSGWDIGAWQAASRSGGGGLFHRG